MYIKLNARNQIVEVADAAYDDSYYEIPGSVAENLPDGLLGFNGRVNTPNYAVLDGAVTARTDEDKARDPYSDPPGTAAPESGLEQRVADCESDIEQIITGLEGIV